MQKVKIANRQLWFILFIMRSTVILSFLPVLTSADAFQDAWISALVALVGSEIIVLLISYIDSRFPGLTVIEYSQRLLGRWVGRLMGLLFLFIFLELSVVNLRIYSEVITTNFLPETPLLFITGFMILNSAFCVYQGIEVLGRAADYLFFIFLATLIGLIFIPLPEINISNIYPVLARGWKPVINGALVPIGLVSQTWILSMLGANITQPKKIIKLSLTSVGLSILMLSLIAFITVTVLGPYEGARSVFPALTLLRSVELSEFLQRTEVLLIVGWGLGVFISLSTYLYSGAAGLAQWVNIENYNYLLIPMSIIWLVLAVYGIKDIFTLYTFLKPTYYVPFSYSMIILPLLALYGGYLVQKLKTKVRRDK